MQCDSGIYRRKGPSCVATCKDPKAAETCELPDTEVCVCPKGQLMEEGKCIPAADCGCIDKMGLRHKVNNLSETAAFPMGSAA